MDLLPKTLEPVLREHQFSSQSLKGKDAVIIVKYYDPTRAEQWLITEAQRLNYGDGIDWLFYGYCYVRGEWGWGFIHLSELQMYRGRFGVAVQIDERLEYGTTVAQYLRLAEGVKA